MANVTEDVTVGCKTTRMLLVTDRPDGVNGGEWATECAQLRTVAFRLPGEPRSPSQGKSGAKGEE